MTTIIVSIIIIASILLLIGAFKWLQNRDKVKMDKKLIHLFNETGEKGNLAFSSQEIICNKVIGLDGVNRKFVVVNENGQCQIINLDDVKRCSVQKKLIPYAFGNEKKEMRVAYIQLYFHLKDKRYESVVFYDYLLHSGSEQAELENKANTWKIILSKIIPAKRRERA